MQINPTPDLLLLRWSQIHRAYRVLDAFFIALDVDLLHAWVGAVFTGLRWIFQTAEYGRHVLGFGRFDRA